MNVKPIDSLEFAKRSYDPQRDGGEEHQVEQQNSKEEQSTTTQTGQTDRDLAPETTNALQTQALLDGLEAVLAPSSTMLENPQLSDMDQKAIELIYRAKQGVDQWGGYVSGALRNHFLNQALASLWPTLSTIPDMRSDALTAQLQDVQDDTAFLKAEIREKIGQEAHPGVCAQVQSVDQAEQHLKGMRLSKVGSLAWELAQLGRKPRRNRRRKFDPTPNRNSIGFAHNALANTAAMICTLAARFAVLEARIERTPKRLYQRIGILQDQLGAVRFQFVDVIQSFLRDCDEESENPSSIGAHSQLKNRFSCLVQSPNEIKRFEDAIPVATQIVKTIDACIVEESSICDESRD